MTIYGLGHFLYNIIFVLIQHGCLANKFLLWISAIVKRLCVYCIHYCKYSEAYRFLFIISSKGKH